MRAVNTQNACFAGSGTYATAGVRRGKGWPLHGGEGGERDDVFDFGDGEESVDNM